MNILVAGATGYVGKAFLEYLLINSDHDVYGIYRDREKAEALKMSGQVKWIKDSDLWLRPLDNIDVVVHLAGRAHKNEKSDQDKRELTENNRHLTERLVAKAASSGVKRFIYLSTILVFAPSNIPFNENSKITPQTLGAQSKYEAETALKERAKKSPMEYVIIRSPLVYGNDAPGNVGKLNRLIRAGGILPFGAINNSRSFTSVTNLCAFISICITHGSAANQTYLVSDAEIISTTEFIRMLAKSMGKNIKLIPIPVWLVIAVFALVGRKRQAISFTQNLTVDCSKAKSELGWEPSLLTGK